MDTSAANKSKSTSGQSTSINNMDLADFCDNDDESLLQMMDAPFEQQIDCSKLRSESLYKGFDNNAGDSWIYPTNYPVRDYQYNITEKALFKNTLVSCSWCRLVILYTNTTKQVAFNHIYDKI